MDNMAVQTVAGVREIALALDERRQAQIYRQSVSLTSLLGYLGQHGLVNDYNEWKKTQ